LDTDPNPCASSEAFQGHRAPAPGRRSNP
jgi:hypothetical protein